MSNLRVLVCAFTCCPDAKPGFSGGEDVLGWNLVKQIARFHEVWALTDQEDQSSIEEALIEESLPNIHFVYVGLPGWLRPMLRFQGAHQIYYYLWQLSAYFTARSLSRRTDFDLFHHITYANDWMVSFIGAFLRIPYVRGPGGGAHRTPKGLEKEYPFKGRIWEKCRSLGQRIFRLDPVFIIGQRRARAILICNRESAANIPAMWAGKVHLFPVSGVSHNDLALAGSVVEEHQQFRVITAGSLLRIKGFSLAIRAFKAFSDKYSNAEFTIVGSGPEEPRLRTLVSKLELEEKVSFLQAIPRDELLLEMASSDVFLFPSLRDGGGTVAIESMAVGKPVVCLDTGGPGTHITEDCGVKVAPLSPKYAVDKLLQALERLYLNTELRLAMGQAAHERAQAYYQWDKLGEDLMEIYNQAVDP